MLEVEKFECRKCEENEREEKSVRERGREKERKSARERDGEKECEGERRRERV